VPYENRAFLLPVQRTGTLKKHSFSKPCQ